MRDLMKQALADVDLSVWPTIALVIFFAFLAGTLLWVLRPGSRELYDSISRYPVDDGELKKAVQEREQILAQREKNHD